VGDKLTDLLRIQHILVKARAKNACSAIKLVNTLLMQTGHTSAEFADDACLREVSYPTGLPTEPVAVAIPHADPDHVHGSAVGIATLASPVAFGQMGTDGTVTLPVRILLLLAIKEREKQVDLIQQVMGVLQSAALLSEMAEAESASELFVLMHGALQE
jgi:PTS system galactitol-specific IIA component